MNHLPILPAPHLSCLHLVEHSSTSLQTVLFATSHPNLHVSTAISVLVPCSPTVVLLLSSASTVEAHDFSRFSRSVFFVDVCARRQHHSSSVKLAIDVWSRIFAFASSPEVQCLFLAPDALFSRSSLRAFSHASLAVSIPCRCSRKLGSGVSLPPSRNDPSSAHPKCPLCRRETSNPFHLIMCQHSCCQHFGRFQIGLLQCDSRHRVFHNSNCIFCNRRLPRCFSWMEIQNNLHVVQHFVRFLVALGSFRIYSQCVHSSEDRYPSFLQQFHHTTAKLVDFRPDVSNCEFCGFIDACPQVHCSRFRPGVIPLRQVTTGNSPGVCVLTTR